MTDTDTTGLTDRSMSGERVLFIGPYLTDELAAVYSTSYSLAGNNKIRGVIESFGTVGAEVDVVAPVSMSGTSLRTFGSRTAEDDDLGTTVRTPATIDAYALNYILLPVFTTLTVLLMLYRDDYDHLVFYNYALKTGGPALIGSVVSGVPLYIEYEDGTVHHEHTVIRTTARVLNRLCAARLAGALCATATLADLVPTENTVIVRGFPSVGHPETLPDPEFEADGTTVVTFAGRFDHVRGIYPFLSVCESIAATRDDVSFWICGYGPAYEDVEARVAELPDAVTFHGTVPDDEYIQRIVSSDILVNLQDPDARISRYTFPSKLLDFMSAGRVVVSTPVSDVAETLGDFVVVTEGDEAAIQRDIDTVVDDIEAHEKRGAAAREWVATECSHETTGQRLARLFD